MAVLEGFKVAIVVNGEELTEYADPDADAANEDPNEATAGSQALHKTNHLIEALSGESFAIRYTEIEGFHNKPSIAGILMDVMVDGSCVDYFSKQNPQIEGTVEGRRRSQNGKASVEPFRFASVKTSCEVPAAPEYLASLKNKNAQLGMIRFRVYRASAFTKIAGLGPGPDFYNDQDIEDATIPEKALKGHLSSHHTRFARAKAAPDRLSYYLDYIDTTSSPYLEFAFKYVSRETLQSLGLVSRESTLVPLDQRDVADMTEQERLRLIAEQRAEIEALKRAKHEVKPTVGIKRYRSLEANDDLSITGARKARRTIVTGETVDLTED